MTVRIVDAGSGDLDAVRELFVAYQRWLGIDLCFQGFDEELAGLPGKYRPPHGALLLARAGDEAVGCVALRRWSDDEAELKRLYLKPAFQGRGIGARLLDAAIGRARSSGYRAIVLDTLASMTTARAAYRARGFVPIPAYYRNPEPGAEYYRLDLAPPREAPPPADTRA